jgi:hypothetical protein
MHFIHHTMQSMQPMQPMQPISSDVNSVQNKELLWSTLQESGAFAGLPSDQFQRVHAAFDRSVQEASRTMSGSLSDMNKHIIREFVQMLRTSSQQQTPTIQTPTVQNQKKKKIEVVYRAEDLQNERASEFDRQLREKQAEMDSFLTLKKPTDVSFTDAASAEDKPIGGEMSRLIAQELAARERELVQLRPEDIKRAQQWIGTTDNNAIKPDTNATNAKKSVSFSNTPAVEVQVEAEEEEEEEEECEPENDFEETNSILSKFKPIQSQSQPKTHASSSIVASITMQQIYAKLIELEQSMNAKHAEIMEHLTNVNK